MEETKVTIIGAGIAGVMAARTLLANGIKDIKIVDKSKSVGGRLATRRMEEGKADHGAQFFTVRSEQLEQDVKLWLQRGWIKHWFGDPYPRYTSVNGMNALVKQLAEDLPVSLYANVESIEETTGGFELKTEDGQSWKTGAVLLTAPVPQSRKLLSGKNVSLQEKEVRKLDRISYNAAIVGLYQFNSPTTLPSEGIIDASLPLHVEKIVDHQKKGISPNPTISVYMEGGWSNDYFSHTDEHVMNRMKEITEHLLPWEDLTNSQIKRWRYAEAENVIYEPYLNVHEALPLYVAGEAFLEKNDKAGRTRFESAYLSGIAAGNKIASFF
ncbi:NAD(P)-binding protein [Pontibacillus yanchengensis]|uniref:NAD(P)-binding protein n=2 Tax=Pontibacillus yanchengensis TaxID=462910 RepID=A0ACC7VIH7_9BACI|nr:FAD-dependent oxidoreductase [Pontibacillus yanchengensis]MYL34553.1 NAD(P)-binding protein [Pontibacillus yanchengensis]MYL54420.1 NAD(P)-binding protein [Pontibacillus yanchengensis]